jgi:hypothetical protein
MAHLTAAPAPSQSAHTHSSWFGFLLSAFFDGLKAYGASLMVISPTDSTSSQNNATAPAPESHKHAAARPQSKNAETAFAFPRPTLPKPVWRNA